MSEQSPPPPPDSDGRSHGEQRHSAAHSDHGAMAPDPAETITVFTPEPALLHPLKLAQEIFRDVLAGRGLAWRMFVRNIKGQYRQTMLGLFWAFLPPLANTALWVFLARRGVTGFGDQIEVNYAVYVLTGMILWQSFIEGLQAPLDTVQANRHMLSKLRFPRESVLMVGVYEAFFNLAVRAVVLVPLLLIFGISWSWGWALAPCGAVLLVLLGVGLGSLIMPFGMLYQDVGKLLAVAIPLWMILTQIVYPAPENWASSPWNWANPASPLLLLTRDLLVLGSSDHILTGAVYAAAAIPLCLVGLVVYRVAVPVLVERVST